MKISIRQKFANYFGPTYHGKTIRQWLKILSDKELSIDFPYWYRVPSTTIKSISNTILAKVESRNYAEEWSNIRVKSPLFILGHWRSGTTLLQNIFAKDFRFAYPNLYQVVNPLTFLISENSPLTKFFSLFVPKQRLFDKISFSLKVPHEDEFIAWHSSGLTSYMGWNFPKAADYFGNYLSFQNASEEEISTWKSELNNFLKKLTLKYNKPLVLKSPQHTCRIKLLLELFPDAKFIHIYRNPYQVFQSTIKLNEFVLKISSFQKYDLEDTKNCIFNQYKEMYDLFFEQKSLIPTGNLAELQFEEFEKQPLVELRRIYQDLKLPDFTKVENLINAYLNSIRAYQKNKYPELDDNTKLDIYKKWERNFTEWGYSA